MHNFKRISIFLIYFLLISVSAYIFYHSYVNYDNLKLLISKVTGAKELMALENRQSEQLMVLVTSLIVLTFSLFLLVRRKYFFQYMKLEKDNLKRLMEQLEEYPDRDKGDKFITLLHRRNSAESYRLMSEIMEELQENNKLAEEANRTKSLFLANMSHEIRTPLNGIVGFTKFLASTNLDKEQMEFLNIIKKSSEDLLGIVNDILDISKIENGNIVLEELYFNPMEEFENVIESYAANASKKDIDFSLWIDPIFSSRLLRSDPGKIKQVLINLISNAVKFTDNRGAIDVIIEKVDKKDEHLSVKFSVKDTGIGISKEQESKVFEAFTQADSTTSRKYGGTGLGLTISATLVNALGGALKVESTIDKGSTFHFTLDIPMKKIQKKVENLPMKIAIYAPFEVQSKDSDHYLEDYLKSFKHFSLMRFENIEDCIKAPTSMFDALYIHYDKIDKMELKEIIKHYGNHANIILVTKLNKRHLVQDIADDFSQIIYEPITFSKVEKSFNYLVEHKDEKNRLSNSSNVERERTSVDTQPTKKLFSNIHALVVEDNPINQKMITHTLKNIGISSECAENGRVGVDMFRKHHEAYDIVFMDIQMPIMNGVEATQTILEYEEYKELQHTPIVAVTANALKGDRESFMSQGLDEYVSKPINLQKFIEVLDIFFPNASASKQLPLVSKTDILLYKETPMEAKIISAILEKLDYSVDVVENIDELKKVMDVNSYKCILLDRVHNEVAHSNVTQHIKSVNIPSLLFVDGKVLTDPSDKETYTFVSDKTTDYESIKEKVDQMIELAKVS